MTIDARATHLGEFEQLILFSLVHLGDEAYGVAIRHEIEARTGRLVSSGAIYTALGRLEERGFVSVVEGAARAGRAGRPRKHYRLEQPGAKALMDTYSTLSDMARGLVRKLASMAGQ